MDIHVSKQQQLRKGVKSQVVDRTHLRLLAWKSPIKFYNTNLCTLSVLNAPSQGFFLFIYSFNC